MRKRVSTSMLALAVVVGALAALPGAGASAASGPIPPVVVVDPTPNQAISGSYTTDDPKSPTGYQQGYIYVDQTGAEACNGNPNTLKRDTPIEAANGTTRGYIWVGQSHQADSALVAVPGGYAGAGTNMKSDAQDNNYGAPCPQYHTNP